MALKGMIALSRARLVMTTLPLLAALATTVGAGLSLVVLEAPGSPAALSLSHLMPAPSVFAARARAELTKPSPDWDIARKEVMRQGRRAGPDAAVRLAYIDIASDKRLDREGINALMSSYDEAPLDAGLARFRIPMVLESWTRVPASLRRQSLWEMQVLWSKYGQRQWLRALPDHLADPNGRLAATLSLQALEGQKDHGKPRPNAAEAL